MISRLLASDRPKDEYDQLTEEILRGISSSNSNGVEEPKQTGSHSESDSDEKDKDKEETKEEKEEEKSVDDQEKEEPEIGPKLPDSEKTKSTKFRVKVYKLENGKAWIDKGTGHVSSAFDSVCTFHNSILRM